MKLRKDAKVSNLKVELQKAKKLRDWAEMDTSPEDSFDIRTPAETEAIQKRFYDACDKYQWHLDRYEIAVERESGVQDMNDHDFTHWHNARGQ